MASATQRKKRRSKLQIKGQGKARKKFNRIHGTTPVFPIHGKTESKAIPEIMSSEVS